MKDNKPEWSIIITSEKGLFDFDFKNLWRYRDLILLFVQRDIASQYKQTILGPLWFFLQPLFTAMIFTLLFFRLGNLSTDHLPPALFYLCGIIFWNYFSECLKRNSTTFLDNQSVFGKVYFPRLVLPISVTVSNLIRLAIQFLLFGLAYGYFISVDAQIKLTSYLFLLPVNIVLLGILGLGLGILISSLTIKYRDLRYLVDFGVQLLMYATIIFPASAFPEKYKWISLYNPLVPLLECTKLGLLGKGTFDLYSYILCAVIAFSSLLVGIIVFNKTEQNFMDIV